MFFLICQAVFSAAAKLSPFSIIVSPISSIINLPGSGFSLNSREETFLIVPFEAVKFLKILY